MESNMEGRMERKITRIPQGENTAQWIWENLVPDSGQSETVQGEILRAIEKLAHEAQANGNFNWDQGFQKLVSFLKDTLLSEKSFSETTRISIERDLSRLEHFIFPTELKDRSDAHLLPCVDDELYDRLTDNLVEFCRFNPQTIPLNDKYQNYR
ncbi:MAG: hypothetical protein Sw1PiTSA_12130 [Shewanella algae]|nr:hypothetical protein [Shewanella algae]MBO2549162.1 hypothetical protein [Shewanella algae]MBO2579326.1 hypothetical protein [Shewanella algae]MBO2634158.1 hypothetical protein [Shewanella algae]MBO2672105.1 hypothetical protein [Shewanella algae]